MTYGPLNGEMTSFVYDCRNRLIQAGNTSYEYDAENNRIGMTKHKGSENETSLTYVIDSASGEYSQVLMSVETDKDGNSKKLYYYYGANLLVAQEEYEEQVKDEAGLADVGEAAVADTYSLYHFNNVGSTVAVTNADGTIKYQYAYSPYGELIEGNYGEVVFLYNGQYGVTSDDNGLYYMRARYYNIDIRRFVNQDVLTGSIERSSSLNRYAYVEGNPVSYLDPFGLERVDTTSLHKAITVASLIAVAATAVAIVASSGSSAVLFLDAYITVSNILAVFDTLVYLYDFCTARNAEERNAAIIGIELNGLGFIIGDVVADLKSIKYIFSEVEQKIISAVVSYDYNAKMASISNYLDGVDQ